MTMDIDIPCEVIVRGAIVLKTKCAVQDIPPELRKNAVEGINSEIVWREFYGARADIPFVTVTHKLTFKYDKELLKVCLGHDPRERLKFSFSANGEIVVLNYLDHVNEGLKNQFLTIWTERSAEILEKEIASAHIK